MNIPDFVLFQTLRRHACGWYDLPRERLQIIYTIFKKQLEVLYNPEVAEWNHVLLDSFLA